MRRPSLRAAAAWLAANLPEDFEGSTHVALVADLFGVPTSKVERAIARAMRDNASRSQ